MRSPSPLERALVGAFIGVTVLLCMHAAASGCTSSFSRAHTRPLIADNDGAGRSQLESPPRLGRAVGAAAIQDHTKTEKAARDGRSPASAAQGIGVQLTPPAPATSQATNANGAGGDALLAARVCHVEAEFQLKDCAAIIYVLRARARRAGWTFERMAVKYSALDADNDRARFARELPDGDLEEWGARDNKRWSAVRRVAALALEGRIKNPARGATHWGSRTIANDRRRATRAIDAGRWRAVDAETVNAFYAEVAR